MKNLKLITKFKFISTKINAIIHNMSDLELVYKCSQRDKFAWDAFIKKYSPLIYNYINSILEQKTYLFSQENVNDVFQEIFVSLTKDNFRKLKTFTAKNGCSLASWLRQVTVNYCVDYLRKFKSTVSLDENIGDELTVKDIIMDETISIASKLNKEDQIIHLKQCVEELDTDDKFFLEFHINQGIRLEIMKDMFRVSRGAIDMRKLRIINRLKDCFKTKGLILEKYC